MAITLSPELESRIQEKVAQGQFSSADQVVEAALYHLDHQQVGLPMSTEDLQAAVDEGLWSEANEPLWTPEEARADLAKLRAELRGE